MANLFPNVYNVCFKNFFLSQKIFKVSFKIQIQIILIPYLNNIILNIFIYLFIYWAWIIKNTDWQMLYKGMEIKALFVLKNKKRKEKIFCEETKTRPSFSKVPTRMSRVF